MSWVVDELDEAIAAGIFEPRELRQATREGKTTYREVSGTSGIAGKKRSEEFITRRPLTLEEQVRLMLAGLRRVLVDLDRIAAASVEHLNDLASLAPSAGDVYVRTELEDQGERMATLVMEIDFAPDEGSSATQVTTEAFRHEDRATRTEYALARIESEL